MHILKKLLKSVYKNPKLCRFKVIFGQYGDRDIVIFITAALVLLELR